MQKETIGQMDEYYKIIAEIKKARTHNMRYKKLPGQ